MDNFPDDDNGQALRNMALSGDNLDKARGVDFSVVFDSEQMARTFGENALSEGYAIDIYGPGENGLWDVTVTVPLVPSHSAITLMEARLAQMAEPLGGRNDGWGCFAVK